MWCNKYYCCWKHLTMISILNIVLNTEHFHSWTPKSILIQIRYEFITIPSKIIIRMYQPKVYWVKNVFTYTCINNYWNIHYTCLGNLKHHLNLILTHPYVILFTWINFIGVFVFFWYTTPKTIIKIIYWHEATVQSFKVSVK